VLNATPPTGRTSLRAGIGLALIAGLAPLTAVAHDEDWLKLVDLEPPYEGPGVTAASPKSVFQTAETQFPAQGLYLHSWVTPSEFEGNQGNIADCWGYVSPSGREYALIGLGNAFGFVEITDPGNPVIVEIIPNVQSLWHDIKVLGEYAYGVNEGGLGIQVIDLSQIDNGTVTLVQNKTQSGHSTTHNIAANPDSGYLYLCGANIANGGLVAVSTSNPANPTIVGSWGGNYVHDAQIVTYTEGDYAGKEIAFCFNGGLGVEVLDVTNKNNMHKIGGVNYENNGYTHQGWLSEDRQYLYMNDETDELSNQVATTTTRVFDVSDPADPVLVGDFTSGSKSIDHNLYTANGYVFEGNYLSGVRVFDIAADPINPPQVAWFDTSAGTDQPKFAGVWSVYPMFPSGTVIASDMTKGLFVLDFDLDKLDLTPVVDPGELLAPGVPTTAVISVAEDGTELVQGTVALHYAVEDNPEVVVPMELVDNGEFAADLPAFECFQDVQYWFTAESTSGRTFSYPQFEKVDAYVASDIEAIESFDFEDVIKASQWTVSGTSPLGKWELFDPQGTPCQPEDDTTEDGMLCWVTGGQSGDTAEDFDVEGVTTLTSPPFDLTGLDDPRMSFSRWYCNAVAQFSASDVFTTELSNDGGDSWVIVEEFGPNGIGTKGGWLDVQVVVKDHVDPTDQVRIRFTVEDADMLSSTVEGAIDDFAITDGTCDPASCPADFNGDGELNVLDFVAFQGAFDAEDPAADFNGDGVFNVLDFTAYQGAFGAGCP